MESYKDVIKRADELVNTYFKCKIDDGRSLNELGKNLASCLYYLGSVRQYHHNLFQKKINQLVDDGKSVARAENQAHVDHPELYELRHIMRSGYEALGMIKTNIYSLTKEINNNL
jgi:hypothetical protein